MGRWGSGDLVSILQAVSLALTARVHWTGSLCRNTPTHARIRTCCLTHPLFSWLYTLTPPPLLPLTPSFPQVLAIRTSTLEEKATACNMIVCYLDELKEGFFPYVQEVRQEEGRP